MKSELLKLAEVARRLRVSHDTVYRLVSSGKLPATKVGRAWRFDAAAIEHLVVVDGRETEVTFHPLVQLEELLDFRDLYENSPDMCLSVDATTRCILCCNVTFLATSGYTRDEVVGRPVDQMYDPACQGRSQEILDQLRATGEVRDAEMVLLTKSGKRLDVSLNVSAVRDAEGRVLYGRSVWRDMSTRKAVQQRDDLISSGLVELIVGDLADAVVVMDEDGHLVYLNALARQFLELGPTDSATRNDLHAKLEIFGSDGRTVLEDAEWPCARALRGEVVPPTEYLLLTRDGARNWMSVRSMPLRNGAGRVVGCVIVLHNTTRDRQREHQLRLTEFSVEHSPDAVFWVRPDGGLDYVNERACQSLGYTREALLKMSVPDFDPDVTREKWPAVWASLKSQQHFHSESRHRTRLGRVFPVEVLATLVEYEGIEYGVTHVRDISSRRRADVQLKESEARFQRAVAGSRDGIWDWDIPSGSVWFSPQYIQLMGWETSETSPGHVDDWVVTLHPEDKPRIMVAVEQHLTGVAPFDIEYRMRVQSGEFRWFRVRGQAFWDADGVAVRMTGTTCDITAQRRVLEVLEHQRHRMQMLIQYTPAAVAMFDRDMRYIIHSDRWLNDYGLAGQSLIGRSHYDVFPDIPQRWKDIHQDCLKGNIRECKQDCFLRDDGTEVWLEWAIHPWTNDDGEIGGIVMFTNVITQRILTEKALDQARKTAESANLAKSEFLANMSHEIRTPLTAILGFTEHLRYIQTDAESISLCETIERNGAHLLDLINDILDLSKVEAGRIDILPERYSPALLTCEIVHTLQGRADQKRLAMVVDLAPDVPEECLLDIRRVRQILINLLGNAIKFTPRGSVTLNVRIAKDEAGEWLEMAVTDTGVGIPSDKLAGLFEAFSQIDSSTTRAQGGTGLGLCISRRLARLCGGDITVASKTDVGSTFTLRLPLIPAPTTTSSVPRRQNPCPPTSKVSHGMANRRPARVLVADDSPDNRRLLQFIFQRSKLAATFVENGQQLVDRLNQANAVDDFDVVLIDMHMPVLDGYSAATLLRDRGCPLPLIALTANAMDGDRQKCQNAGCDDYVTKPIHRETLLETIAAWNGHRRAEPPSREMERAPRSTPLTGCS